LRLVKLWLSKITKTRPQQACLLGAFPNLSDGVHNYDK
jgi:hypothetical protein